MTLISTIIPAYNASEFIRETLESVLSQTVQKTEIIVVDDGSTDSTCEIVESFGERVRLIMQENAGPAAARNRGVREATGEWIAFLDADDIWYSNKLELQLQKAKETGASFVYANRRNIGDCEHVSELQSDGVELVEGDVFEKLLLGNVITLSSVLLRRDIFEKAGGFNESADFKAVEDWELWLRLAEDHRFELCREPLLEYRFHANGISRNVSTMEKNIFNVLESTFRRERGRTVPSRIKRHAYASAWSVLGWSEASNHPRSSLKYFCRAWVLNPTRLHLFKQVIKSAMGRA